MTSSSPVFAFIDQQRERFLDELMALVTKPSVSTQAAHKADVRSVAQWLVERLSSLQVEAELLEHPTGNHPLVYGRYHASDSAPTVLLYGHYDVQPAVLADGWDSEPFEPSLRDGKLYGRGSADSKVNVLAQLAALEALLHENALAVNIIVAFEGEEESGGATLAGLVVEQPERFTSDITVICDGSVIDNQYPSLAVGLRGIFSLELTVKGPVRDVHSGQFGGTLHNPIQALCELIATMHDGDGRIAVEGFYDDVRELSDDERAKLAPANARLEQTWQQVAGAPAYYGEPGYSLHERTGVRPTLEINGIRGGYAEDGFKTVIPSTALAKISCRLVANQDPADVLAKVQAHIQKHTPSTVTSHVNVLEKGSPAVLLGTDAPAVKIMQTALETYWQNEIVFELGGGSVPIVSLMGPLAKDTVLVGFGHRGSQVHGPNEHIYVDNFYKGISTIVSFLQAVAAQ
ncbi:MAG: dipeptidase [Deinococcota bacterium]